MLRNFCSDFYNMRNYSSAAMDFLFGVIFYLFVTCLFSLFDDKSTLTVVPALIVVD